MRLIIFILMAIVSFQAMAKEEPGSSFRSLSNKDYESISRCSKAAIIMILAWDQFPDQKHSRLSFMDRTVGLLEDKNYSEKRGVTGDEIISAFFAMETLLSRGVKPNTKNSHDWFIAQMAASCALEASKSNA